MSAAGCGVCYLPCGPQHLLVQKLPGSYSTYQGGMRMIGISRILFKRKTLTGVTRHNHSVEDDVSQTVFERTVLIYTHTHLPKYVRDTNACICCDTHSSVTFPQKCEQISLVTPDKVLIADQ